MAKLLKEYLRESGTTISDIAAAHQREVAENTQKANEHRKGAEVFKHDPKLHELHKSLATHYSNAASAHHDIAMHYLSRGR